MESNEIETRVIKVMGQVLGVSPDKITTGSRFVEDLGAESVQSLELVGAFESEFDIEMDEEAALQIKSVGDAVEFIRKYVN